MDFGKGRGSMGILNTWGKDLKNICFATDGENPDQRFIELTNHRDLASNCEKQLKILIHLAEKCSKTEWYALVDDDTYVYADNLIEFLNGKETQEPVCYSQMMQLWPGDMNLIHPSGGAGYILNKSSLKLISHALQNLTVLKTAPNHWKNHYKTIHLDSEIDRNSHPANVGFGDVAIGLYMRELNIKLIHCDKFHSRQPWCISKQRKQSQEIVNKNIIEHQTFNKNITFHTITEQQMYNEKWNQIECINTDEEYNEI